MKKTNLWKQAKRIVCIRPDNLGDVLLTSPAFRAIKQSFPNAELTLVTSQKGAAIAQFIPEIDEVLVFDVPWVKTDIQNGAESVQEMVQTLKQKAFDGAIVFTTYSQNPLSTVMLAYLAEIPLRLAYCRENPYQLLTDWVPDTEGLTGTIHRGVKRQLELVKTIGAVTDDTTLSLTVDHTVKDSVRRLLRAKEVALDQPIVLLHPGASEKKRQFSPQVFAKAAKMLAEQYACQIILTGVQDERPLTDELQKNIGLRAFSFAGEGTLEQFIALVSMADLLISNDTGPVHIASAVQTPVVVLYANANREHTPWQVRSKVLYFDIHEDMRSKNELLRFTQQPIAKPDVTADEIVQASISLLSHKHGSERKELIVL